jgi:large subunit ribosomal protein L35
MPKMKAHKGLLKRFKVTGTGKIKRQRSYGTHLMSTKSSKRRRHIGGTAIITGKAGKTMKRDMCV